MFQLSGRSHQKTKSANPLLVNSCRHSGFETIEIKRVAVVSGQTKNINKNSKNHFTHQNVHNNVQNEISQKSQEDANSEGRINE